jgi:hypothetical protein
VIPNRIEGVAMPYYWEEAKAKRETPGYYYLAKRDLERGGETLMIICDLPVLYAEIEKLAYEYDKAELESDPRSDYRYFVEPMSEEEIAEYKAAKAK